MNSMFSKTLEWTDWTMDEEYPSSTCRFDRHTATIKAIYVNGDNGHWNRHWEVKRGDFVVASGHTLGTKNAEMFCEMALWCDGVQKIAHELTEIRARYYPGKVREG